MRSWFEWSSLRHLLFLVALGQVINTSAVAQLGDANPSQSAGGISTPQIGQFVFTYDLAYLPRQVRVQTAINAQSQSSVVPIALEIIGCGSEPIVIPARRFSHVKGAFAGNVTTLNNYGANCQPDSLVVFFNQMSTQESEHFEVFTYRIRKNNLGNFIVKRVNVRILQSVTKNE
ncbi:MAG: hypothetical protein FD163_535 [Hyphomonadaceae bacterium]|nr:MAG: hypothetical protein FD163_535 [Hyphomonadaceae bacterium]